MDFQLSEEQLMLKKNARDFLQKEIVPIIDDYERNRIVIPHDETVKLLKMLTPLGYIVGLVPENLGGQELSLVSYGLLMEELSYAWGSLVSIVNIQGTLPKGVFREGWMLK